MESRQYCGNRKNCLHTMQNTPYQPLHEKVQETLCSVKKNNCEPNSLCSGLPYVTAYVNPQSYTGLVSPELALTRGSAFNNLFWPYNECKR
jgi:hypothetical protein